VRNLGGPREAVVDGRAETARCARRTAVSPGLGQVWSGDASLTGPPDDHDRATSTAGPFTELAKITLADDSLDRVMGRVAALAKSTLNLNGEVSVTVIDAGKPSTIASTGSLATALDERQYDRGHGPCLDCIAGGEPLMVKDMDTEQRWPDWARSASSNTVQLVLHGCSLGSCLVRDGRSRSRIVGCRIWCRWGS